MRCKQCEWCDSHDYNENGCTCMVSWPVQEFKDGRCSRFTPECEADLSKFHGIKKEEAAIVREQLLRWKESGDESVMRRGVG